MILLTRHAAKSLSRLLFISTLLVASSSHALITDFAGGYAGNLATMEAPSLGAPAVEVFYGRIEFIVSTKGAVSGFMLTRAGKKYPFTSTVTQGTGALTADKADITLLADRLKVVLTKLSLSLKTDGTFDVTGTNTNPLDITGSFYETDSYKYTLFTGKVGSIPAWTGKYTLALTGANPAGASIPAGAGYATLSVATTGILSYVGKLGDGTAITGTVKPRATSEYSLYLTPTTYAVGGYCSMQFDVNARGLQPDLALWNKPIRLTDKAYPSGFNTSLQIIVQPWLVPAKGAYPLDVALGFGSSKNFDVVFSNDGLSDGDYSATLPTKLRMTGLGVVQAVSGAMNAPAENNSVEWNKLWSVKLNPLTGGFTGKQTLRHLSGLKIITRTIPVEGVICLESALSTSPFAYGQYRVTPAAVNSKEVSGHVSFKGPLINNVAVATSGTYSVKIEETLFTDGTTAISSGIYTPARTPVRPTGSPANGVTVRFTVSENLQTLTFNGQVLTFIGPGLGGRTYTKITIPRGLGQLGGQFTVSITIDPVTGAITYVSGFTQFISASFTSSRAQATAFEVLEPEAVNLIKL